MNSLSIYDELNDAIEGLIAAPASAPETANLRPGVGELVNVAHDLQQLPRAEFKSRLRVELEWQAAGRAMSRAAFTHEADAAPLFVRKPGLYPVRGVNLAASAALHLCLFLFLGTSVVLVKNTARVADQNMADANKIGVYLPAGGGGGGGTVSKTDVSKGEPVPFARRQIAPPTVDTSPSRIQVWATLVGAPELNLPQNHIGNPLSALLTPSGGPGVRGGIGAGDSGGDGIGKGPGRGPGSGGGEGSKFYLLGNGVTAPRAIYSPEPDYSDEARHAKLQGIVTLAAVIGPDGHPRQVQIARGLGLGLDEKAMAAVRTWRFEPGMKDGHPVAVQIFVEVDFRLF